MARPKQQGFLVNLRGTAEYERFLVRLAKLEKVRGHNAVAERAIEFLADRHCLDIPRRMPPRGRPRKAEPEKTSGKIPKSRKKS